MAILAVLRDRASLNKRMRVAGWEACPTGYLPSLSRSAIAIAVAITATEG